MPNGLPDEVPVTWGRWQESLAGVTRRLDLLEGQVADRRRHLWAFGTILLGSLLLPLLVVALTVWLHLRVGH
jgi:hypothetical protein